MIKSILKTATIRQSAITFTGTVINGALGILFFIVVARELGPSGLGVLTVAIVTLTLVSDIADIGTNTGLVRFVSSSIQNDKEKAMKYLKLSLEIKLLVWLVTGTLFFLLSPFIASEIFHKRELGSPLRLVALGIGGALLFSFATSTLQALQKYFIWSVINITTNLIRLILVIALGFFVKFGVEYSLFIYILLPFLGFFIATFVLPTKNILVSKNEFRLTRELFSYNVPVAIFTIIAAFSARLDTFLTASLLSAKEVGIYGVANQPLQAIPQLISALGIVAAPKFASFTNKNQMITYLKKFQLLVLGLFLLGLLSIPVGIYLIPVMYGWEYQGAVLPFTILLVAMLIFLFSIPIHNSIFFYFGRPDIFIWVSIGHLIIIGGLGYFMISNYGVVGASMTVLTGTVFNFLAPLFWFLNKIRQ